MAAHLVRNEEAAGSIPASSTMFSVSYESRKSQTCSTLFQKIKSSIVVCLNNSDQSPF
jgi:hypothetical protein